MRIKNLTTKERERSRKQQPFQPWNDWVGRASPSEPEYTPKGFLRGYHICHYMIYLPKSRMWQKIKSRTGSFSSTLNCLERLAVFIFPFNKPVGGTTAHNGGGEAWAAEFIVLREFIYAMGQNQNLLSDQFRTSFRHHFRNRPRFRILETS